MIKKIFLFCRSDIPETQIILDTSPGVTPGTILSRNHRIGRDLFIFPYLTMPVSGYLVAWQYYQLSHNDSWGDTHVTVWRLEGDNYYRISDIILTPDNKTGGPQFQYVHNKVIRVEPGDFIGIYATSKNFISMSIGDSNQKTAKQLQHSIIYTGDSSLSKTKFHAIGKREVSLRAFVAGRYINQ